MKRLDTPFLVAVAEHIKQMKADGRLATWDIPERDIGPQRPWSCVLPGPVGAALGFNALQAGEKWYALGMQGEYKPLGIELLPEGIEIQEGKCPEECRTYGPHVWTQESTLGAVWRLSSTQRGHGWLKNKRSRPLRKR